MRIGATLRVEERFRRLFGLSSSEDKAAEPSNWPLVRRLLRESFRRYAAGYAIAIVAMAIGAVMTGATAWLIKHTTDEFMQERDLGRIALIAGAVASVFIVKGLATYVQTVALSRVGNSIVAERQMKAYGRVLDQGLAFYNANSSADLITRVTHGAQAARGVIDLIVTSFARDALTLVALLSVMIVQQPRLSVAVLIAGPLVFALLYVLLRKVRAAMRLEYKSMAEIVSVMQETVLGARVVKSFQLEPLMLGRMREAVSDVRARSNMIASLEAITHPVMETLAGLLIAGAILISGTLVVRHGQSTGDIMGFVTALILAYEPVKRLTRARVSLESGMVGVRIMFELEDAELAIAERSVAVPLRSTQGRIELQGVTFSYVRDAVLDNLSLRFAPRKMTALVGPSGGGKSTIFNLIMRLYDPAAGCITIDDQDIRDVTFRSLRQTIGYVGQETFLFTGSILNNLRIAREDATEQEVVEAAKLANAHDFIMSMPEGYDTNIGENGVKLSGGQRQRLSIARAMLKNAPIMLFDEATSALDPLSEALFREALDTFRKDRTVIVIAHRLSTIRKADAIVVIKDGTVAETGTHEELMTLNGSYTRLHNA